MRPRLALCGVLGGVAYRFFFFAALQRTAVVDTSIINATCPIVTGLSLALREPARP